MFYHDTIRQHSDDAEKLELTYQQAVKAGEAGAFAEALEAGYIEDTDNLLYAAWHYRLAYAVASARRRLVAWRWAIPLAILNGLLLWLISDDQLFVIRLTNPLTGLDRRAIPVLLLLAAPISAAVLTAFLTGAGSKDWNRVVTALLGLVVAAGYVWLFFPGMWPRVYQEQYLGLMVLHLALFAWATVGLVAMTSQRDVANRVTFLAKSLEAFVVGGVFVIAGGLFTAITFGLFDALGIEPPAAVVRLFMAGGAGLIVVIAVALVYDPTVTPAQQSFDEGLSRLVTMLTRLLLPLTVLVLLIYLAFIPFNFWEPFENRDVLVIFNAMLFAVMALLVGATPLREHEPGARAQTWLRRGICALAILALIVGVYALAAISWRTSIDRLTPNRLTFIGWNVINIALLGWLLIQQARAGRARWLPALHSTLAAGAVLYVAWTIVGIVVLPWLFHGSPDDVAHLPPRIQTIVYEQAEPILLKCINSPHIYRLEDGAKRWIKDIPTFQAQGYRWSDVTHVPCADLRAVPDGPPIPPDAGPPPQP